MSHSSLDIEDLRKMVSHIAKRIDENKEMLSELDAVAGDGDHGVGMHRGFSAVMNKMERYDNNDLGAFFKMVGMTLISTIGGATGPLFGTIFYNGSRVLAGKTEIGLEDFASAFKSGLEGVKTRGGAQVGDRTMVDSLEPAVMALEKASEEGLSLEEALERATIAAEKGVEATKGLVAKKGRSVYLGERVLGYEDAGATSIYLIFRAMKEALEE